MAAVLNRPSNFEELVVHFWREYRDWIPVKVVALDQFIVRYMGKEYTVFFTYRTGDMPAYLDLRPFDLVICWVANFPFEALPVYELKDGKPWEPVEADPNKVEIYYWKQQAQQYKTQLQRLQEEQEEEPIDLISTASSAINKRAERYGRLTTRQS